MTQDQYGQARGPGYVIRGETVPDEETDGYLTQEAKPATRFQKVASALRRDGTERDEAERDEAVAVTSPDVPAAGTAGRHAAGLAADEMRPGEAAGGLGDFSDLTYGNLIPDAGQYTSQWQQIQFKFVDDPRASVTEAADIIAQVTAKMEAAIQERQRAIEERQRAIAEQQRTLRGRWGESANADTEALRETLRMYKTFLDQLIGSRAS